ncbi:hypothetical protein BRADI_4g37300v3 [Brachypodium distachyon]|uniref:KIB1-4 beta-propeller domain-containing protein n=1 Tax=Brachypodium distachyon TaxID=15368 RepID=A0A2K2CSV9_BRADI|nr:hypothetical protein BRADI_4g37300v3 [Brachypodium distachyon]
MRDWGDGLPQELLECIAGRLTSAGDAAAFRLINRSWKAALPFSRFAPVQMLPFDPNSPEVAVTFSRPTHDGVGETFTRNLPAVRGKVVCGSSCGWVALMDEAGSLTLLNPFTGATAELPPANATVAANSRRRARASVVDGRSRWVLETSPDGLQLGQEEEQQPVVTLGEMRHVFFREIVLSSPPDSGGVCVAMAVLAASRAVMYCRVGPGGAWTRLNSRLPGCVSTAVHCRGNKFLALGYNGEVSICECDTDGDMAAAGAAYMGGTIVPPRLFCRRGYLMVDGELHLVGTSRRRFQNAATTYRTHVYKCNVLGRTPAWTRVKKLEWTSQKKGKPRKDKKFDQMTLLVSNRFTTGCSGPTLSGLASNSVYFCEPMYATPEDPHHRIEIGHVDNGTSEYQQRIQQGSEQSLCWIQPSIWTQRYV